MSWSIYRIETEKRIVKADAIELSNIRYGLFSVDEWKKIISKIIIKRVEAFNLEGNNREMMKEKVSKLLYELIEDLQKSNQQKKSKSLLGFIQGNVASLSGTFSLMKKEVPNYTEKIVAFLDKPENRNLLRDHIIKKVNEYADETFSKIDYSKVDAIIEKYRHKDIKEASTGIQQRIIDLDQKNRAEKIGVLILLTVSLLILFWKKDLTKKEYLLSILISLALLIMGLLLPMIEIDARISEMNFSLLGEPVNFSNQVLYYKSKSILEVVSLMITQKSIDLIFVGFLVFAFSVLFPILKLISSVLYLYLPFIKSSPFISFMVFKTGKWSMADVMVITIFMAYLGFGGILTEQLNQIESVMKNMEIITTNNSSLLVGFYFFTAFTLLSLLTSHKIQYHLES